MYGGMCTGNYVSGLVSTLNDLSQRGVNASWVHIMNEALITRARNAIVKFFLEQPDADYLMFIDADISFPGDGVAQLLASDKDIVCGIYPKKEINWPRINAAAKEGKENLQDYGGAFVVNSITPGDWVSMENGLIECQHCGTAFMLIKRHVFLDLLPHVPTYHTSVGRNEIGEYNLPIMHEFFATSIDESGILLSEDFHFCELWRKHGGKVYANPFIRLQHVGTYVYSGDLLTQIRAS